MESIFKNNAIYLFELGLKPIPLKGKAPIINGWQNINVTDTVLEEWIHDYPTRNIGIICGPPSGIVVVDFDDPNEINILKEKTGIDLNLETPTCITKKGIHKYFKYPENGQPIKNRAGIKIHGIKSKIDIRGDGGQIVAPPSIHPDDTTFQYHWAEGLAFDQVELQEIPDEFLNILIQSSEPKKKKENKKSVHIPSPFDPEKMLNNQSRSYTDDEVPEGCRNDTLFRMACKYRSQGLTLEEVYQLISNVNQTKCNEPLDDEELEKIIESAFSYRSKQFELNDRGFAQQTHDKYGDRIKYCINDENWYIWNGSCWKCDKKNIEIMRLSGQVVDSLMNDIELISDSDLMKKRYQYYVKSIGNHQKQLNMLNCLKIIDGVPVQQNDFDHHHDLLNCKNGIINLRTGELLPANRELLLSKQIQHEYVPAAECPTWMSFLNSITNSNPELIEYLQRAVGYTMTGETNEEVIFFLYGNGCNGKSTFINTINSILGVYAKAIPSQTLFMGRSDNSASNDIAMLDGIRLASTTELPEGKQLNEENIKSLASQDKIVARFLYKEYFELIPTHKWWIAGNHKPNVTGQDYGIWRRIKLIPFEVTIPDDQRDKNLSQKLQKEANGILQWMVEGAVKWYAGGLQEASIVKNAVNDYRKEMDIIGNFIKECCDKDKSCSIKFSVFYLLYKDYCKNNGLYPQSNKTLSIKMRERGFSITNRTNNIVYILGLRIKDCMLKPIENYSNSRY